MMNIVHKISFALVAAFLAISCNSGKKQTDPQPTAQDSIQVKQPELPPLEPGEVEYKDDAFREVIELEGHNLVADSFVFMPTNSKVLVKGKYMIMRVEVYTRDLHPFIIFKYPEMTYVTEVGQYGNGPDEFLLGDIIPTDDPKYLCYLMETTREKLYKLNRKGQIEPYSFSFSSSPEYRPFGSLKEYIHNVGEDDFIYSDKSKSGRSIYRSYAKGDSVIREELCSLQADPKVRNPFAYMGYMAINAKKNRIAYAYRYYKKLKFMTLNADTIKDINYNLKEFDIETLNIANGLDRNATHYCYITGGENYVYVVHSGRVPSDMTADWSYINVEQYDWNGNPIRKYKLKNFFGKIYVDEARKRMVGITFAYDDPFVEFKLPE